MTRRRDPVVERDPIARARLATVVRELAAAIASGEVTPGRGELEALAILCDIRALPIEATRVRRWLGPA